MNAFRKNKWDSTHQVTVLIPDESTLDLFTNAINEIGSIRVKSLTNNDAWDEKVELSAEDESWIREMESFDSF